MNIRLVIDFYTRNALFDSNQTYEEKLAHLEWFYQFDEITTEVLTEYCAKRRLEGVKNSTINREITVMRSAFNYYLEHNHDANFKNIFNRFKLFEDDFIPRYLNEVECRRLLYFSKKLNDTRLHDYIMLLLNTGCRSGELLSLEWDSVNLDQRYMVVRNSLSKNKKTVYKPLNLECVFAFNRLRQVHDNPKYVFYNPKTGKPIVSFRHGFKAAVEKAGIGDLRIHDLRHTFASFLVQKGVPIYQVSTLLGHSDTRITQKYAHLAPNYLHDCMKSLPSFS